MIRHRTTYTVDEKKRVYVCAAAIYCRKCFTIPFSETKW